MTRSRRPLGDTGTTLVESLIAMLLLSVVLGLSTGLFVSVQRSNNYSDAYSRDANALRQALSRMTIDVRQAGAVQAASTSTSIVLWVDKNHDNAQTANELITYSLVGYTDTSGVVTTQLRRSIGSSTAYSVVAQGLTNTGIFTYYASGVAGSAGAATNLVKISLTGNSTVSGQHPNQPAVSTQVFLRD